MSKSPLLGAYSGGGGGEKRKNRGVKVTPSSPHQTCEFFQYLPDRNIIATTGLHVTTQYDINTSLSQDVSFLMNVLVCVCFLNQSLDSPPFKNSRIPPASVFRTYLTTIIRLHYQQNHTDTNVQFTDNVKQW